MSVLDARGLFEYDRKDDSWYLKIKNQGLKPFCHGNDQKRVLAIKGDNIGINEKVVSPEKLARNRDSTTNALLIHSRGDLIDPPCDQYAKALKKA